MNSLLPPVHRRKPLRAFWPSPPRLLPSLVLGDLL